MGFPMHYRHPSEIMDEIARLTPTFAGVSFERLDELGSIQWPCNEKAPAGTPVMHIGGFVRGKGRFVITEYVADRREGRTALPAAAHHRPHPLSQYNVGAQTRRTENVVWHEEDVLEIHPHDAEQRGIRDGDWVKLVSRAGETSAARAHHRARGAGRRLHDVPPPGHPGERRHHRLLRLGDQLPGIQGDRGAGRAARTARREWQEDYDSLSRQEPPDRPGGGGGVGPRDEGAIEPICAPSWPGVAIDVASACHMIAPIRRVGRQAWRAGASHRRRAHDPRRDRSRLHL